MKIAVATLLAAIPGHASAFFAPSSRRPAFSNAAAATPRLSSATTAAVATGPEGKPAASAEEDLELTLGVILEKIAEDEEDDADADDDADGALSVENEEADEDADEVADDEVENVAAIEEEVETEVEDNSLDDDGVDGNVAEFQSLLRTRRTINDFDPTLPDGWEDAVVRAITSATYAPNHKRTEPWRFHLLGPNAVRNVCELNAEIVSRKKGEAAGQKKLDRWLKMPGWLVVTCVQEEGESSGSDSSGSSMDENPAGLARENYAAVCCAVQNLCLSLHSEGIGTKWTTGPVNFDERFGEAAGIPENEYVVGTMWFGTAAKVPDPPKKKLSLEDVLTRHD